MKIQPCYPKKFIKDLKVGDWVKVKDNCFTIDPEDNYNYFDLNGSFRKIIKIDKYKSSAISFGIIKIYLVNEDLGWFGKNDLEVLDED